MGLWQLERRNFLKEKGHSRSQKRYIRRPAPSASTRGPSRRGRPVAGHLDRRGPWGPWLVDAAAAARDPSPPTCAKRAAASEAKAWPEERNVFKVKWSDKSVLKLCLEDVLKHIVEDDAKWTSRCKQRGGVPPSSGNEER